MKLSIVIVNYNVKYYLEQCLNSVLKTCNLVETEIYVVDNDSSDDSLTYLKPRFPEVCFIANEVNVGFSKANNQAINLATGEYVLLLNPDTVVGENTLNRVCDFMDNHPDAGALGVWMTDGFGYFLPESKRGFPSPWNSFCKMFGLSSLFPRSPLFGGYQLLYLDKYQEHRVDVLAGAFMLLRKKTLNKTGLLDESFFMYGEDIDLSYRIKKSGYENYYLPEKIIHYKGESTKKNVRYVRIFYEAMLIFYRKHYPQASRLYSVVIHLAVYLLASLSAVDKYVLARWKRKDKDKSKLLFIGNTETSNRAIALLQSYRKGDNVVCIDAASKNISLQIKDGMFDEVVFCSNCLTFENMMSLMTACSWKKKILFRIFHLEQNTLIAADEVLI